MSFLPIQKHERDAANAYLAGMAARGFATTVCRAIRQASPTNPLNWPANKERNFD